jgi:hypothetical protein
MGGAKAAATSYLRWLWDTLLVRRMGGLVLRAHAWVEILGVQPLSRNRTFPLAA